MTATPRATALQATAIALIVATLASSSPGLSATYTSMGSHYSFQYPDAWTPATNASGDAVYLGASSGGFRPNVVAQHEGEPTARNTSGWLLAYAQNSLQQVKTELSATEVQPPRTFTTASGRVAADYIFERPVANLTVRQRQVFFVSEYWQTAYFFTLSDKTSTYASHAADWSLIVDSFAVVGEPAPSSSGSLLFTVALAIGGAAAVGVGAFMIVRSRRVAAARTTPATAPVAAPPPQAPR